MRWKILSASCLLAFNVGCAAKYSPLANTVDLSNSDFSNIEQMTTGESCQRLLFGAIPVGGSASIVNAVRDSGVTQVSMVEYQARSKVIFIENCVVVHGFK